MKNKIGILLMMISVSVFSQKKENNHVTPNTTHAVLRDSISYEKEFRKKYQPIGYVSCGLKAGYSYSNIYGNEIAYIFADSKTGGFNGFHAGVQVNTQWHPYFWLKHEWLFSMRGAKVSINDSVNGNYSSLLKMYYLDLYPVSPSFHIKGFQLYAGPYLSLLTAASIQRKNETGNYFTDRTIFGTPGNREDKNENKYLQKFDFGLHTGIEYQFPFGLFIGAKYMHGFTDIFQYANSYTFEDPKVDKIKIYNRALMVSVGYSFIKK